MTWTLVFVLAAVAYTFKVLGVVVIGSRPLPAAIERCLALVPAALLSALIVTRHVHRRSAARARRPRRRGGGGRLRGVAASPVRGGHRVGGGDDSSASARRLSRSRLPAQMRRSTGAAARPPTPAPSHQGKRSSSVQVSSVCPGRSAGASWNTPVPGHGAVVADPHRVRWIPLGDRQRVVDAERADAGVAHEAGPHPSGAGRCSNSIERASAIHSTWRAMSSR